MTDSPLSGRIALITGASGGIGKCIARGLAESGVDLFLTYARHGDDAEEVGEYARGLGRRAVVASADLADPAAPASLVGQANREPGGVDILIANAGTATVRGWQNTDLELWNTTQDQSDRAVSACPAGTAGHDRTALRPRAFVSSIAGLNGGVVGTHYAASKAGLHGLHHLALRVGVTVNALAPALVGHTRMFPVDPETGTAPVPIPVGRVGRPDEVADMAIAMLRNGYLTNKVITLDGGILPR